MSPPPAQEEDSEDQAEEESAPEYLGRTIRVFVSYSTLDKHIAGSIKEQLEARGIEVFLAHEDISPSAEWQDVILQRLKAADIFIPLITENFRGSVWTDQESGIAIAGDKKIIPLMPEGGDAPHGFLSRVQALRFNPSRIEETGIEIARLIKNDALFRDALLDSEIRALRGSLSFEQSGRRAARLLEFDEISEEQMREILRVSEKNSQIYHSWSARRRIKRLVERHREVVDIEQLKKLNEAIGEEFF